MATQGKNHEAIKKAVLLLSELTRKSGPSGVTELARALDMPKATVHRILGILCEDNVVVKTADGRYKVGPTVLLWSGGYRYSTAVIELAAPWLRRLRDATNETVHLCVYNNGAAQYADRLDSTQNVTLRWSRLGSELPLYCTSAGRAILSQLPQEELDAYLDSAELSPRTARTVTSKEDLKKMLARFRAQGYAEEIEENEDNIRCLQHPLPRRRDNGPRGVPRRGDQPDRADLPLYRRGCREVRPDDRGVRARDFKTASVARGVFRFAQKTACAGTPHLKK